MHLLFDHRYRQKRQDIQYLAEALDALDGVGKSLATSIRRGLLTFSRRRGYSDSTYAVHVGDIFFFLRSEFRQNSSGLLVLAAKEPFNDLQRVAIHLLLALRY